MRSVLLATFAVVTAAGCGDDAGTPEAGPDAPSADTPIDTPNLPVVGEWRMYDPSLPAGTFKNVLSLGADGKLAFVREDHTFRGVWDILPDGRLHTMKDSLYEAGNYYVSGNRLVTGSFVPSGSISGVVGTWTTHDNFANNDTYRTIVLRSDLTMSLTFTGSQSRSATGTYVVDGTHLTLTETDGSTIYLVAIPDAAIGQSVYERVEP